MFKSLILCIIYILLSSIILVQDVNSRHLWDHCLDTSFYCKYLEITSELYIKITNRTTAAEDVLLPLIGLCRNIGMRNKAIWCLAGSYSSSLVKNGRKLHITVLTKIREVLLSLHLFLSLIQRIHEIFKSFLTDGLSSLESCQLILTCFRRYTNC